MISELWSLGLEELSFQFACARYLLGPGRRQVKHKVLIVGPMKTGTTWMMHLVSSVPGYRSANIVEVSDVHEFVAFRPGDVIQGHWKLFPTFKEILVSGNYRIILMIRDPRDQLVSYMFHVRRRVENPLHKLVADVSFDEALMCLMEKWQQKNESIAGNRGVQGNIEVIQSWLEARDGLPILPVKYEDLYANPVLQFTIILRHLLIELNEKMVRSVVSRNRFERLVIGKRFWKDQRAAGQEDTSSHFRKGITGDWQNYFNARHKQCFKELAGDWLVKLGYEDDSSW